MFDKLKNVACGVIDYVADNPIKCAAVAGVTVLSGGAAYLAAPAFGVFVSKAGFGVAAGTLRGAAAAKAGLAVLGGGSLASGGAGVVGGKTVVTGVGAATGGFVSGVVASKCD